MDTFEAKQTITALLILMEKARQLDLLSQVTWPDEENRKTKEIDAIAGRFAIEHTTVDGIPKQRLYDRQFVQMIEGLKNELSPILTCVVIVTLGYEELTKIKSAQNFRLQLRRRLLDKIPGLRPGTSTQIGLNEDLPVCIRIDAMTDSERRIFFQRSRPVDRVSSEDLCSQLKKKAEKLGRYSEGHTTILLVESWNEGFLGVQDFWDRIEEHFEGGKIPGVDEIWFAASSPDAMNLWSSRAQPEGLLERCERERDVSWRILEPEFEERGSRERFEAALASLPDIEPEDYDKL